jgi:hypothetical protein
MDQNSHIRAEAVNMPLMINISTITDCFYYRDEVELRARTNIALQQNIDFITLRQWYNMFNVVGTKEVYLRPPSGVKNAKGSAFCLELFIHEDIVSLLSAFVYHLVNFHSTLNGLVKMTVMRWMECHQNPNLARSERGQRAATRICRCPSALGVSFICHQTISIQVT